MNEIRKENKKSQIICSEKCRFCDILEGNRKMGIIDNPILENDKFFSLASIGGFIDGWSLVIPKEHTYSMRKFFTDSAFVDIEDAKGYIHIIEKPESQYFRRLLAEKEGYTKEYDYKCNLFLDKGEATYASLVKKYDEERTDSN